MTATIHEVDYDLHDCCEELVRRHGAQTPEWLARRARRDGHNARIDGHSVVDVVDVSTMLFWRPDGTIDHVIRVLDGIALTQRARSPLAGRGDLWCGAGLQPLLNIADYQPIPLVGGGEVKRMASGHDVLVGPDGWLPDVGRLELVALRLQDGHIRAEAVPSDSLPSPEEEQVVRSLVADHYRRDLWWTGADDLVTRPAELVRALALARLEDPQLLTRPYPPLDELLHNALERDLDVCHWQAIAAQRQGQTVSFSISGMPEALDIELRHRADRYGMSSSQFVIAILGHLAWRTPFAEDLGPWKQWNPEPATGVRTLHPVPSTSEATPDERG